MLAPAHTVRFATVNGRCISLQGTLRDPQRLVLGHLQQQHREFVAAQARHRVRGPHHAGQPPRDLDQDDITRAVPETVVDRLELVQIEQQHTRRPVAAVGAGAGLPDPVAQQRPVGQTGQRIVKRHPFQLPPGLIQARYGR